MEKRSVKTPLVSIITPSFNDGAFIEDNILSVKCQDYPKIEHIIVDGGSTDSTLDILHKYKAINWVSEPDRGVTDAFNKGIDIASGDILAFQNSDDVYYSRDAVRKAVTAMTNKPEAAVIFGDCAFSDEEGKVTGFSSENKQRFSYAALLCSEFTIPLTSAFIRRSAIEDLGGKLDTTLNLVPDWELWTRIGLKFPIIYVAETFGIFRDYGERAGASLRCAIESPVHRRIILDRIFQKADLPLEIRALQKRAYAGTYTNQAYMLLNANRSNMARKCVGTAIKLYPRNILNPLVISYLFRAIGCGSFVDWASVMRRKILKRRAHLKEYKTIRWWLQ
jgi:glycosyltransferase involved in cell wall biosynthesis